MSFPSPTIRRVQVLPPSKETARNIPAVPSAMFVKTTMLFGFVGFRTIASSDSLPARWLTSTFLGILLFTLAAPLDNATIAIAAMESAAALAMRRCNRVNFEQLHQIGVFLDSEMPLS